MWISRRVVTLALPWAFWNPGSKSGSSPHQHEEFPPRPPRPRIAWMSDEQQQQQQQQQQPGADTLADWICRFTPTDFRVAVRETGHFLYRGAGENELQQILQQPAPDLLLPETYGYDPVALAYFQCLEERLNQEEHTNRRYEQQPTVLQAKPSTGHIATSNPKEAGRWGPVVSVWPLGDNWSYIWPRDRDTFFDDAATTKSSSSSCREDQLIVDSGIVEALQKPREVLFATTGGQLLRTTPSLQVAPSAFLAISQDQDKSLRRILSTRNYGLPR